MNANEALQVNIEMADTIAMAYLQDLSDEELMHRPAPQANHIKWQLGHLLSSDNQMINGVTPGKLDPLPEGFAERYSRETATSDDAKQFDSKDDLLALYQKQKEAILNALQEQSAEDLDRPTPEEMQNYAATVGAAFSIIGSHWIMHAGQWAVIRRQLGREPLF